MRQVRTVLLVCALFYMHGCTTEKQYVSSHPPSTFVVGIEFDLGSMVTLAEGSDNWAITWSKDGSQFTTWGDGGGFNGTNHKGRVSMGVARLDGPVDEFKASNIWGGYQGLKSAEFKGKSYGILAVHDTLWLWRTGEGSSDSAFTHQDLFYSTDHGLSWQSAGVRFSPENFEGSSPFFAPTFLQFGPGYQGSRDEYVYIYAPDVSTGEWDVQVPGTISLMRVPMGSLAVHDEYEYFAGPGDQGQAVWVKDINQRRSVFSDENGVMRTAVTYNQNLGRYLLITQQVSRFRENNGHIGIYEATQPWGPWYTVLFANPWGLGLQDGEKTVYWNFSNKWSGSGMQFVMIYTGPGSDNFGLVQGRFITANNASMKGEPE